MHYAVDSIHLTSQCLFTERKMKKMPENRGYYWHLTWQLKLCTQRLRTQTESWIIIYECVFKLWWLFVQISGSLRHRNRILVKNVETNLFAWCGGWRGLFILPSECNRVQCGHWQLYIKPSSDQYLVLMKQGFQYSSQIWIKAETC